MSDGAKTGTEAKHYPVTPQPRTDAAWKDLDAADAFHNGWQWMHSCREIEDIATEALKVAGEALGDIANGEMKPTRPGGAVARYITREEMQAIAHQTLAALERLQRKHTMKLNEQETNEAINLLEQFNHCYGKDETGLSGMEIVEPVTPVTVSMINSLDEFLERLKSKTV